MIADTLSQALRLQLGYVTYTCNVNLDGVNDDDALVGPDQGGNCVNWIVGHLLHARAGLLEMLGVASPYPKEKYERYGRNADPVQGPERTVPLSGMRDDLDTTNELLEAAYADLTNESIAREAPIKPTGKDDETMGSLLVGLVFHESYHAGQLGLLRRVGGRAGAI